MAGVILMGLSMAIKNSETALVKLTGEVHALYLFVQALARTHSNPSLALEEFERASQAGLAFLEPHAVPDVMIATYQETVEGLQRAIRSNPRYIQKEQP
jgi:hypothetical protein